MIEQLILITRDFRVSTMKQEDQTKVVIRWRTDSNSVSEWALVQEKLFEGAMHEFGAKDYIDSFLRYLRVTPNVYTGPADKVY